MPIWIKNIEGNVLDNFVSEVALTKSPSGEIGQGDYIKIGTITAFLQDYSQVESTEEFPTLVNYGLKQTTEFIELNISY